MPADPLRWKALTVVCAAFFMTVLDVSIVNVALPSIGKALDFSRDSLQWVLTAYSIMFGGFLMLGGRLADLGGRRRVFMIGVVLFTVSSLLCGLAWSEGSLIAFRAAQGLGGALLSPAALSILTTTFAEGSARTRAISMYSSASAAGASIGVLLGGLLTDLLSWRWAFFLNIPVALAVLVVAPAVVKESRPAERPRLDLPSELETELAAEAAHLGLPLQEYL